MTRAGDTAKTRQQLLTAARALIAELGVASATVEAISRRAGVTKGAFYYSFTSKEALLAEVAQSLRVDVVPLAADLSTVSAVELAVALQAAVDGSRDALRLQLELWLYASRNPELRALLGAAARDNRAGIVERLAFTDDPAAGLTAQSLLIGVVMLILIDDSLSTAELAAALEPVMAAQRTPPSGVSP